MGKYCPRWVYMTVVAQACYDYVTLDLGTGLLVISNKYDKGLKNGALGGKLLGAGGGGFILFYVENKKIPNFKRAFSSNILVPVNLSDKGSEVIFYEK